MSEDKYHSPHENFFFKPDYIHIRSWHTRKSMKSYSSKGVNRFQVKMSINCWHRLVTLHKSCFCCICCHRSHLAFINLNIKNLSVTDSGDSNLAAKDLSHCAIEDHL